MPIRSLPLLLVLLASLHAPSAGAESVAERSYGGFVKSVADRAQARAPGADGTRRWEATLKTAEDVRRVSIALDAALAALARAPAHERPRALELEERLRPLRRGLSFAASLGVDPGTLLEVHLRLSQDAGGWDSVVWGERAYPTASGEVLLTLRVPDRYRPMKSAMDPVYAGCEFAQYEMWEEADLGRRSAQYAAYLDEVRRFVPAALKAAHLSKLPEALVVLDPPDAAFSRALEPGTRPLPFAVRTLPVGEWADQTPSASDGPARRKAFREAWEEMRQTDYAREYRGNCALIAQKLVLEPLEPLIEKGRLERRRKVLGAWVRPSVHRQVALLAEPSPNAPRVGLLPRGSEVETLEGVEPDEQSGELSLAPYIRVRSGSLVGWVPREQGQPWRSGARSGVETLVALSPEPPESLAELALRLDRQASAWRLAREASEHLLGPKAQESRLQAEEAFDAFCRLKAQLQSESTAAAFERYQSQARERRLKAGEPEARVKALLAATWSAPTCGAPTAAPSATPAR